MIFVTVGTHHFDDLVRVVDQAVADGRIDRPVVIQTGRGDYVPRHCSWFRKRPSLDEYYRQAELVVGHGGTGTTIETLHRHIRLISVANPMMRDDHQREFLQRLEGLGYLTVCDTLEELPALIRRALDADIPPRHPIEQLFAPVAQAIEEFPDLHRR